MPEIVRLLWVGILFKSRNLGNEYVIDNMDRDLLGSILLEYLESKSSNNSGIFKVEVVKDVVIIEGTEPHQGSTLLCTINGNIKEWNAWLKVRIENKFTGIT